MRSTGLALIVAALSCGWAQAQSRAAQDKVFYQRIDAATQDLAKRVREIKSCKEDVAFYTAELARRKQDIAARNGGKIPTPYSPLLLVMEKRIERTRTTCQQRFAQAGTGFDQIQAFLRSMQLQMEPEKQSVRSRMAALAKIRAEYNRLGVGPAAAKADESGSDSDSSSDSEGSSSPR